MKKMIPAGVLILALQSPSMAATFTLREALDLSLQKNLSIRDAQLKKAGAEEKVNEIVGGAYPQLSMTTSAMGINMMDSSSASSLSMGLGGLGGGLGGIGGLGGLSGLGSGGNSFSLMQTSFSLNQVLFDGFRTKDGLALASL
ncbi:MAG TPA: TolC family protein, partial [Chroococcales cyanobacterium]